MSTLVVQNLSLGVGGLPNGSVTTDDIADSAITTAKIAPGAVVSTDLSGNQTGTAPIYGARAWVNFNGTGTVAIRASGNVTSITDNGVGDYSINFTTAMPDANYSTSGSASRSGAGTRGTFFELHPSTAYTTSSVTIRTGTIDTGPTTADCATVTAVILR